MYTNCCPQSTDRVIQITGDRERAILTITRILELIKEVRGRVLPLWALQGLRSDVAHRWGSSCLLWCASIKIEIFLASAVIIINSIDIRVLLYRSPHERWSLNYVSACNL